MASSNQGKGDQPYEAFVGFYTKHQVSPVRQDISDMSRHYGRRDHLYRNMGILPFSVAGKTVIEFGPGSGHNALYTTSLDPARYVLVDANPKGLNDSKALLAEYFPDKTCHEFVLSRIQAFESDERFDVVLCEGVIPHQDDPVAFTRHVGKYTKPGGVLVITTADYVGFLAEVLRRLIRDTLIDSDADIKKQLEILCPLFASHCATLPGMSRPVEDWVTDNILHPWVNPLFSIEEAITGLDDQFEVVGTSPRFITDWRWHKDIYGAQALVNQVAIEQYRKSGLSVIDYRFVLPELDAAVGKRIQDLCEKVYWLMVDIETKKTPRFVEVSALCDELSAILTPIAPETAAGIDEASVYFRNPSAYDPATCFNRFKPFFGRAQQYISFVRKPD